MTSNQNLRVFWKPVNLQDCVWENLYRIIMKTKLQEKETTHCMHYNLVHKFILMHQAMKFFAAKGSGGQGMGTNGEKSAWNVTKVRSKKEVIDEARTKGAKVHFASLMDIRHLKNAELETKHQKYKGPVVFRGDIVKDDSGSYVVFIEQGSSAIQTARLRGTSSWRSICLYWGKTWKTFQKYWKFPNRTVQSFWIRPPRHKWPKSWSIMEDPVVLLERNLYGHLLAGLLWERHYDKILLKCGWEKVSNWECLFVHREKGLFFFCVCGWHQIGWKEAKHWSDVEILNKEVDLWEPPFFLDHVYLGCTQRQWWNKQGSCGQLQSHVWITNFRVGELKHYHTRKTLVFLRGLTIFRFMPRYVWNDIVSWRTRRLSNSTKYLLHASMTITLEE